MVEQETLIKAKTVDTPDPIIGLDLVLKFSQLDSPGSPLAFALIQIVNNLLDQTPELIFIPPRTISREERQGQLDSVIEREPKLIRYYEHLVAGHVTVAILETQVLGQYLNTYYGLDNQLLRNQSVSRQYLITILTQSAMHEYADRKLAFFADRYMARAYRNFLKNSMGKNIILSSQFEDPTMHHFTRTHILRTNDMLGDAQVPLIKSTHEISEKSNIISLPMPAAVIEYMNWWKESRQKYEGWTGSYKDIEQFSPVVLASLESLKKILGKRLHKITFTDLILDLSHNRSINVPESHAALIFDLAQKEHTELRAEYRRKRMVFPPKPVVSQNQSLNDRYYALIADKTLPEIFYLINCLPETSRFIILRLFGYVDNSETDEVFAEKSGIALRTLALHKLEALEKLVYLLENAKLAAFQGQEISLIIPESPYVRGVPGESLKLSLARNNMRDMASNQAFVTTLLESERDVLLYMSKMEKGVYVHSMKEVAQLAFISPATTPRVLARIRQKWDQFTHQK